MPCKVFYHKVFPFYSVSNPINYLFGPQNDFAYFYQLISFSLIYPFELAQIGLKIRVPASFRILVQFVCSLHFCFLFTVPAPPPPPPLPPPFSQAHPERQKTNASASVVNNTL